MKKVMYFILSLLIGTSLFSCGQKKTESGDGKVIYDTIPATEIKIVAEYFFSGGFSYMADAAVLKEIASGTNIPVAMAEAFPEAEKQYMELKPSPGEAIYGEFKGYMREKGADEEGPDQQLVITQVNVLDKTKKNNASGLLTGEYIASDQTLTVNPDHTYELTVRGGESEKGKWFLTSADMIVFSSANSGHTIMEIRSSGKEFVTRDDVPVTFKKR